jgi:adenylate cyclase
MKISSLKKYGKILKFDTYKLGILLTLIVTWLTINHFEKRRLTDIEGSQLHTVIEFIHDLTVDARLRIRGTIEPADNIAMIVVDEQAVEQIGRWPWSREKMAEMIEQLKKDGAFLIGFDAIFSEPQIDNAVETYNKLKSTSLSEESKSIIEQAIANSDKDSMFGDAVKKHSDSLVLGVYFEGATQYPNDKYKEHCADLMATTSPEHEYMDKQNSVRVFVEEKAFSFEIPIGYREYFTSYLKTQVENYELARYFNLDFNSDSFDSQLEEKVKTDPKNADRLKRQATINYCSRWLVPGEDPFLDATKNDQWPEIVKLDTEKRKELGLSAEEGMASLYPNFEAFKLAMDSGTVVNTVERAGRYWANVPQVSQNLKNVGYFNAFQDSDGTLRHSRLITRYGGTYFPSLSLYMAAKAQNAQIKLEQVIDPKHPDRIMAKSLSFLSAENQVIDSVPMDSQGRIAINYAGPGKSYPHLSVAELLNGKEEITVHQLVYNEEAQRTEEVSKRVKRADFIKDKLFLFGATAVGIFDLRVTPFDENFPGLETHANVLDNLLNHNFLTANEREAVVLPWIIFSLGLLLTFFIGKTGAFNGFLSTAAALFLIYYFDQKYFFEKGTITTIVIPILLTLMLYTSLTLFKYFTEERNKKAIKGTFEKYVSPSVVNEILKDPVNLQLGGRKQKMSVLFSDVRGFTTISEKLDPTALSDVLNAYLTPMTKIVFDTKGTLDKYMGDAIMAFFGAPINYPEHAKMACLCAIKMMEKLREIQIDFEKRSLPKIDIGIGINTGDMSVGNMGSDIVRSYTVMGDSVNLGSRLEGINKEYGTNIIISEFTFEEVKNDFLTREVDWVRVKGKNKPVRIFELVGLKNQPEDVQKVTSLFSVGFELYHQMKWQEAIAHFESAITLNPQDGLSILYKERCEEYLNNPPPTDWDGVHTMTTK